MPIIKAKAVKTIRTERQLPVTQDHYGLWKLNLKHGAIAKVALPVKSEKIYVKIENYEVPSSLVNELKENDSDEIDDYSEGHQEIICQLSRDLSGAICTVLGHIKYHLFHYDIHEGYVATVSEHWSEDGVDWKIIPSALSVRLLSYRKTSIHPKNAIRIQKSIDEGLLPLMAMRHLHRAVLESENRYKWIDATTAAELAVKEILIRKNPNLKILLETMPSPSLNKLYGDVLHEYMGEASPYKNKLGKGANVRNKLIHNPNFEDVNDESTDKYVDMVEKAIFHLLSIAYPDSDLINIARKVAER